MEVCLFVMCSRIFFLVLLLLDMYDVPSVVVSLPGLGICINLAIFCNMCEMVFVLSETGPKHVTVLKIFQ